MVTLTAPRLAAAAPASTPLGQSALFLDLDGTLAPFAERPDGVRPDPRRTALLTRLGEALDGRVAVISGREVAAVDCILQGAVASVAGSHGLERRDATGRTHAAAPHPALAEAIARLRAFADDRPGVLIETKAATVALHYRGAPDAADPAAQLAEAMARETGLSLQPGAYVLELRTPGADKGDAVRAFMSEPPFAGSTPIFIGDDLTDEAGFAAASALGGWGMLVRERRATAATAWLPDVEGVLAWLGRSLDAGAFVAEAQP